MDKILIDLFIPALTEQYELFIPSDVLLGELLPVLVDGVCIMSSFVYVPSGEELLCKREGVMMELNLTAKQAGVRNGDYLFLI